MLSQGIAGVEKNILALDIGYGTQDVLLYNPDIPIENCVKMVLPSRTTLLAGRIAELTREKRPIFLTGNLMGGGPCVGAIRNHLKAGLPVYATELAAKTINDNPDSVRKKGIIITEEAPSGSVEMKMGDIDLEALQSALGHFDVKLPSLYAAAVQDHGDSPYMSNRKFRFQIWKNFAEEGGHIKNLVYFKAPSYLTRMLAVQRDLPNAIVMDTASAAIWGAFCDETVESNRSEGILILNIGNQHTVGALAQGDHILGLFEHHTRLLDTSRLKSCLEDFRAGTLTNERVFNDGGHGACITAKYQQQKPFRFTTVTGPQRRMAHGLGYHFAVPNGDMMLVGCFGLVNAFQSIKSSA